MQKSKSATNPKTAIVTRTKNRNLLLKRALESVKLQTYDDFVHVVVNDGGGKEAVDKIVSNYNHKIKVIHNEKSKGLTRALNQGIRAVDTKYISILDDDDSWSADRLEKTVSYLEAMGTKGVVNVMDRVVEEVIDNKKIREISKNRLHQDLETINLYKQCLDNYMTNGCFTYRRSVYDELGGYDERLLVAEDWDFGIRFLLKYDIDFLHTDHALHFYHHRPEAKGRIGNSVFDRADEHKRHINILSNYYLRQDINSGNFGIGYIMNSLQYRRDTVTPYEEERILAQTVRLEAHVNRSKEELRTELQSFIQNDRENNTFAARVKRKIRSLIK